jgi:glycosyltransferase involved in cell wall biosynthesis
MISVLLPVRNAAISLAAALDSLLLQSLTDFEVLCLDDGSDDDQGAGPGTREVLEFFSCRDGRIRPVFLPHRGIVRALNHGLDMARGEFIARMDADDVCHPQRLERQAAYLEDHPDAGLVACRAAFGGDPGQAGGYKRHLDWTNTLLTHEQIALGRFRESPLVHPTVMFRKTAVERHGTYADGPFPEDYELWLRWLDAGVRMTKLPETLYTWNDPPDRLSRVHSRYSVAAFYRTKARYLARWLEANNPLHPRVLVMGAGRITRRRAEMLLEHGVEISAWADIDPRKIGKAVAGREVIHREDIPGQGQAYILSYVAGHGAAEDIAAFLSSRGYVEGRNFILAA